MIKEIKKNDVLRLVINRDKKELQIFLTDGYQPKYNFDVVGYSNILEHLKKFMPITLNYLPLGFREKNILENLIEVEREGDIFNFYCIDKNKPYSQNDSFSCKGNKVIS